MRFKGVKKKRGVGELGKVIIIASLIMGLLMAGCASRQGFSPKLRSITKPYSFSLSKWELKALAQELKGVFKSPERASKAEVIRYFNLVSEIGDLKSEINKLAAGENSNIDSLKSRLEILEAEKERLEDKVQATLEEQVKAILIQEGILNPLDKWFNLRFIFPPLSFKIEKPPNLLVISPRERIEIIKRIHLRQNLSLEEKERIESQVDKLGVSSLVIEVGGIATYPSMVVENADLHWILNTIIEEWLHKYLAFRPLGFLYLLDTLGIRRDYEIATMNETLAGMVSKELGSEVYRKYYGEEERPKKEVKKSGFDFNKEMRKIRMKVDEYLAQGKIEEAEKFMEEKRKYLAEKGHYIRKLNQAYFAFYGTYAYEPASVSPINDELNELRKRSKSLKDFLDKVSGMTGHKALKATLLSLQKP